MKILFFNYEYPPLGGGAANATEQILQEFSKIPDLRLDLITSSATPDYQEEKISDSIKIYKLPIGKNEKNLHFQSQKDLLLYSWKAYWFAKKLIKKEKYDLSHSFFTVPCGFISMLLKRRYKIPYLVSLRGSDVPGYSDRFPLIYAFLKPIFSMIWKQSGAVISNSEGLKELAHKTNPKQNIKVIYNGIDTKKFKPAPNNNSQEFIITPGASRLTARKGLKYLVDAVKILKTRYPQIKLEILAEGDEKENLEKLTKDLKLENNVKFIGRVPHEKVNEYYERARAFVLPSLNEGMSNAMLEALATGLPIIATDTGGTKELLKDGENGFIIKMKDSKDIASKLEVLVNNPDLRNKMAVESRKIAENMSWGKVAEEYYELYKQITNIK